ncbi:Insertion Element Protein [Salisediminibacterium beveridgei]|uniref:Insertion Element Protein n=1 Tax=Salisediminibacterium beveridgei TaxID=632773 RepID=A0A1D7QRS5_9BACI|nr:Insertion Element Protein [Salisediminibacterium beveridgei]
MNGDVTHITLFYWRHKLLTALKQMEISNFQGIVEMDETYFLYSEKGQGKIHHRKPRKRGGFSKKRGVRNEKVCVLVTRNREEQLSICQFRYDRKNPHQGADPERE